MIAARLDTLPLDEKQLLQEAAVIGRVFWLGSLGRERWTLEERLHSLARKEFVSRERLSSVAGEQEYVFSHALVRDVAYEQIPKAERAPKHRAAAEWIESLGRNDDHAETLAYHYAAALEYARAAGHDTEPYAERASSALREAGDRAFALNAFGRAARLYERALDVLPLDDLERPQLLLALGRSLWSSEARGEEELIAARDALLAAGDRGGAAEAEVLLTDVLWNGGRRDEAAGHIEAARALATELEPSRAKALTLLAVARHLSRSGDFEEVARIAHEALGLAESLELDELRAHALATLGFARMELDEDEAGLADLEEGIEVSLAIGSPEAIRAHANFAHQLRHRGEFARAVAVHDEALRLSARFGNAPLQRMLTAMTPQARYRQGRWDESVRLADEFLEEVGTSHVQVWQTLGTRALIRLARDDDLGVEDAVASIQAARRSLDPGTLCAALGVHAWTLVLVDRHAEARAALDEALAIADSGVYRLGFDLTYKVAAGYELGYDVDRVLARARPSTWAEAARWYFAGTFDRAADLYEEAGSRTDESEARLRAGQHLLEAGRRADADIQLKKALDFYRSVGATRFVRTAEALLLEIPA
jgi:tetratricopeptide (TPR) repeat protein